MSPTPVKILDTFFGNYTKIKYKKGDIIIRPLDVPQGIFYLKKGFVRMYLLGANGAMLMLQIYKPNSFFPMTWGVNNTPNMYYFEAMNKVEVMRAPKEDVIKFLQKNPDVLYDLASRLLTGFTGILKRIEHLVMDNAYDKTILLLLYLAENIGEKEGKGVKLSIHVTHREISAWIGTTRETASLQVEKLEKKKIIVYHRRDLIIPDLKLLESELTRAR